MLSNGDFAGLVRSGADLRRADDDGQKRFDLKTIKQWDRQIKSQQQQRNGGAAKGKNVFGDGDDEETAAPAAEKKAKGFLPPGYRDRAEERRKAAASEEGTGLEDLVGSMDAEQTKFLGGDMEHTHLVKGLDYALLNRMREQACPAEYESEESAEKPLELLTPLGQRLHKLLLAPKVSAPAPEDAEKDRVAFVRIDTAPRTDPRAAGRSSATFTRSSLTRMYRKLGRAGQTLSRTVFEFCAADEVPGTTVRAAREAVEGADLVNYSLPKALATQLTACCDEKGQLRARGPRRRKETTALPPGVSAAVPRNPVAVSSAAAAAAASAGTRPPAPVAAGSGDLYGDILGEAVGNYDASLVTRSAEPSPGAAPLAAGLFSQAKPRAPAHAPVPAPSSSAAALTRGMQRGDQALAPLQALARGPQLPGSGAGAGAKVVYRDVFASTAAKVVERAAEDVLGGAQTGAAFGLRGTYDDVFPETSGYYDAFMDSGDEADAAAPRKRARPAKK